MDTKDENKKRLASMIVIITSVLLCSAASWGFTMVGASFGMGIIGKWPEFEESIFLEKYPEAHSDYIIDKDRFPLLVLQAIKEGVL